MRSYLLLLLLTLPLVARTQTLLDEKQQDLLGRGHISVGVNIGQGYRGTYPTTSSIAPRIQSFIANGWSIALEGRYLLSNIYHQSGNRPDYTLWGGGLSTRYYFIRHKRLALFAHAGAIYGQSAFHLTPDAPASPVTLSHTRQMELSLGMHYRLSKRWSVEATGGRSWLHNTTVVSSGFLPPDDFNRWQFSVGLTYQLL